MLSAEVIVLEYLCPCLGMIAANFMFAAPFQSVRDAIAHGTLGSLNPTPWAFMTGNCIGWVTYSYLINNLFLFSANAPGLMLSVWLNMAAAKLQYCDSVSHNMRGSFVQLLDENRASFRNVGDQVPLGGEDDDGVNEEGTGSQQQRHQHEATLSNGSNDAHTFANLKKMALNVTIQNISVPAPHEKVVVSIVSFWIAVISILHFLSLTIDKWKVIIGFVVNINLLFFYGAPLSTIYTVLTTRDSSSIHRRTMFLNTANAVFWTAFGFGTTDWFIIVPNGLGAILGFVQMALRIVVPSRDDAFASSSISKDAANSSETNKGDIESGMGTTAAASLSKTAVDDSLLTNS